MMSMKILMNIFSKIAQALQYVLTDKANELAKKNGFIRRSRKITGSNFVKTLLFAFIFRRASRFLKIALTT
jgi:hypothetical protein